MRILVQYDKSGPKYHRLLVPANFMEAEVKVCYRPTEEDLAWCDIFFINRMVQDTKIETLVAAREKHGFKLVVDLDDHWLLGPEHLLYETYKYHKLSEIIASFIRIADVVTVTHDRLALEVQRLNPNVHILPNAIPKEDQFLVKKEPSPVVRLFWAGGVTHRKDIEILRGPSHRMNQLGVKWVLGGYMKEVEWQAMAAMFTNGGRFDHEVITALPVHEYYKVYSKCDISLVPLQNNTFNTYKSNLKILEAANIGSPVIVSRVHPYLDFPDSIVNYVDRQGDWYHHTRKLLPIWKEQGQALQAYCNEYYNFTKINKQREQLFHDSIESYKTGAVSPEAGRVAQ